MTQINWHGLYRERWNSLIHPDAISHPAKFSRALIRQIYQHAIDEGWLFVGDSVLDCFGGVGLGAFDALQHGLHWQGIELEEKFVKLGNQNIDLWQSRYAGRLPVWGTANLIQGDSRKLGEVVKKHKAAIISSPPYAGSIQQSNDGIDYSKIKSGGKNRTKGRAAIGDGYGNTGGQLSEMVNGDFEAVISSPPFVESLASDNPEKRGGLFKDVKRKNDKTLTATYGYTDGQLGIMKAGSMAVMKSPPYSVDALGHNGKPTKIDREKALHNRLNNRYGETSGQLAQLREGEFDAAICSPPFENGCEGVMRTSKFKDPAAFAKAQLHKGHAVTFEAKMAAMQRDEERASYGTSEGNIGNQSGETFWSASRLILEQCYQVLAPNAHAIFVCKDFVRNKKIVPFCEQWVRLCEAVGFRLLHVHKAWLVEPKDGQRRFDGSIDDHTVERKSFFRRLAEKKGSPRIDYEMVLCFSSQTRAK
jgi:tRNA1(Val) A37 N6-methylase TrmN6